MEEKEEKNPDKKETKPSMGKLDYNSAKVLKTGDKQKSVLLTTDGSNVNIQPNNVNKLELEMMLMKSLQYVRSQ